MLKKASKLLCVALTMRRAVFTSLDATKAFWGRYGACKGNEYAIGVFSPNTADFVGCYNFVTGKLYSNEGNAKFDATTAYVIRAFSRAADVIR